MTGRTATNPLRARAPLASEAGQALVEFAFLLPVFLLLVIGMLHFGKAFNYWIDETHLANEAARYAAVNKNPGGASASLQEWIRQQANTPELRDGGTESVPDPLEVCIEFPEGPAVGAPVTVEVQATYDWIPFLDASLPASTVTLSGSATMRMEQLPTNYEAGCVGGAGT